MVRVVPWPLPATLPTPKPAKVIEVGVFPDFSVPDQLVVSLVMLLVQIPLKFIKPGFRAALQAR